MSKTCHQYITAFGRVILIVLCLCSGVPGAENTNGPGGKPAKQATRSFAPPPAINFREPVRHYSERQTNGWTFYIEKEMIDRQPQSADKVVVRLNAKLDETLALFPEHCRQRLHQIPVYVLFGSRSTNGGRDNGAEYFRRIDPDYHKLLETRWRDVLVIYSAANYLWQNEHWAVQMLLHEFAHAWHLERWIERQPVILAAWKNARDTGLYQNVKDVNGTVVEKAYAVRNQLEYFAELSSAYYWRGEYEPFDRKSLKEYDPTGHAMIETMWGVKQSPPPVSPRAGEVGEAQGAGR